MSATIQDEFHPDAERLNAFAEQALGRRERAEVLAHLAVCSRCRRVVTLASEATDADVTAEAVAPGGRRAVVRPRTCWRSWWIAAAPAAALAATAVLAVYMHVRNEERVAEVAKVEPPTGAQEPSASPQQPAEKANPALPAKPTAEAKNPPLAPAPMVRERKTTTRELVPHGIGERYEVETPPEPSDTQAQATVNPSSTTEVAPAPPEGMPGARLDYVQRAPGAAPRPPQGVSGGAARHGATVVYEAAPPSVAAQQQNELQQQAENKRRSMAERAAARDGRGEEAQASAAQPPAAAPAPEPTPLGPHPESPIHESERNASAAATTIHLPSGSAAVSVVFAGRRELAIDDAGTLFISEDAGGTWERVPLQWTGRAVRVRRRVAVNGAFAEANPAQSPVVFFELLNDRKQVWESTDGKTWTAH